jgi:hypothetical protein
MIHVIRMGDVARIERIHSFPNHATCKWPGCFAEGGLLPICAVHWSVLRPTSRGKLKQES